MTNLTKEDVERIETAYARNTVSEGTLPLSYNHYDKNDPAMMSTIRYHGGAAWLRIPHKIQEEDLAGLVVEAVNALPALIASWHRARELEAALLKINEIRNCIIGTQALNWSAHVYPLVAALDEAGIEGMGYDAAQPHYSTLLERAVQAEDRAKELEAENMGLRAVLEKKRL